MRRGRRGPGAHNAPHVSIRRVSAIARDAATGKRRQIVPLDAVTHGSNP